MPSLNQNWQRNVCLFGNSLTLLIKALYPGAMIMIRPSRPDEGSRIIEIWRGAVDATHDFLTPEDRLAIDEMVCGFLPQAPLWLAVDENDYALAFMLIDEGHMEALFVDPA